MPNQRKTSSRVVKYVKLLEIAAEQYHKRAPDIPTAAHIIGAIYGISHREVANDLLAFRRYFSVIREIKDTKDKDLFTTKEKADD